MRLIVDGIIINVDGVFICEDFLTLFCSKEYHHSIAVIRTIDDGSHLILLGSNGKIGYELRNIYANPINSIDYSRGNFEFKFEIVNKYD